MNGAVWLHDWLPIISMSPASALLQGDELLEKEMERVAAGETMQVRSEPLHNTVLSAGWPRGIRAASPWHLLPASTALAVLYLVLPAPQAMDTARYNLDPPPPTKRNDYTAWRAALDNAHAQLEHQQNR